MSGETEEKTSGWTTDTLHQHIQTEINDLRTLLQERYETQTKALDKAFAAAEQAVATALLSAEKAVNKAETAADKRFESVNEFRDQLRDQAQTFIGKSEADVRFHSITEKIDANASKLSELELRLSSRLDLTKGAASGIDKAWGWLLGAVGLIGSVIAIILTVAN